VLLCCRAESEDLKGLSVFLEVDLINAVDMPPAARARGYQIEYLRSLKDKTFYRKEKIASAQIIIQDAPAMLAGYPILCLEDFLARLSSGEIFELWPSRGRHTVTAQQYWKRVEEKSEEMRTCYSFILASKITSLEAKAFGAKDNKEDQQLQDEVSLGNYSCVWHRYSDFFSLKNTSSHVQHRFSLGVVSFCVESLAREAMLSMASLASYIS